MRPSGNTAELHVATGLDHFTGDLMPEYQSRRSRSATRYRVLIARSDICGPPAFVKALS
jgi:hypothetical protein